MHPGIVGAAASAVGVDADVQAHFDRASTTDEALKTDLDNLIVGLKDDGIWTKLDVLCVAHDNQSDSLLNLRGTGNGPDSTLTGTPTFTTNYGFTVSSAAYVDTNQAENAGTTYLQYDANYMCYVQSTEAAGNAFYGCGSAFQTRMSDGFNQEGFTITIEGGGNTPVGGGGGGGVGIGSVVAIADRRFRHNDTELANTTSTAYTLLATNFTAYSFSGTHDISMWGLGGGLTAIEMGDYENRLRTYAQARGFDVF